MAASEAGKGGQPKEGSQRRQPKEAGKGGSQRRQPKEAGKGGNQRKQPKEAVKGRQPKKTICLTSKVHFHWWIGALRYSNI